MVEQLERYIEAALAALTALLAWCWRIARLDTNRQARIERLEQWRAAHDDACEQRRREDLAARKELQAELIAIKIEQAKQGATLEAMNDIARESRDVLRQLMQSRKYIGNRWYDPPEEQP